VAGGRTATTSFDMGPAVIETGPNDQLCQNVLNSISETEVDGIKLEPTIQHSGDNASINGSALNPRYMVTNSHQSKTNISSGGGNDSTSCVRHQRRSYVMANTTGTNNADGANTTACTIVVSENEANNDTVITDESSGKKGSSAVSEQQKELLSDFFGRFIMDVPTRPGLDSGNSGASLDPHPLDSPNSMLPQRSISITDPTLADLELDHKPACFSFTDEALQHHTRATTSATMLKFSGS